MITSPTLVETQLITGDELLAMGDIGPCELIDGRIVLMSPTNIEHASLETIISWYLHGFVTNKDLGWVLVGEVGIYIRRRPDRIRAADVAFISKQRLPTRPRRGYLTVAPELVIEIVSPDDRWEGIRKKVEEYFSIGVERVWIMEPDNKQVLVFHSATEFQTLSEADTLKGEGILDGFEASVAKLFAEA